MSSSRAAKFFPGGGKVRANITKLMTQSNCACLDTSTVNKATPGSFSPSYQISSARQRARLATLNLNGKVIYGNYGEPITINYAGRYEGMPNASNNRFRYS